MLGLTSDIGREIHVRTMTKMMTTTISGRVKGHKQEEQVGRRVFPMDTTGLVVVVVKDGHGISSVGVVPNENIVTRILVFIVLQHKGCV